MEHPALGTHRAAGVQAPKADLSSLAPWRCQDGSLAPATRDDILGSQVPCRPQGDTGQSGQENGWGGWRQVPDAAATAPSCSKSGSSPQSNARATSLDS